MKLRAVLVLLLLAGCAYGRGLVPGQSTVDDVRVSMGEPTLVRDYSDGTRTLWYSKLPYGRESWAAVVDKNGVLLGFEQRLTDKWISRVQPEKSTAEDALDLIGPPYRRVKMALKDAEAWEYQVRTMPENQTLYLEVSPDGVVRKAYRLFDRDIRRPFSFP
jgi:hypothetical protein